LTRQQNQERTAGKYCEDDNFSMFENM